MAPKLQEGDLPDPYRIRAGLKTDDELSQLRRRRRTGKRLERFHRKQNDVSFSLISYYFDVVLTGKWSAHPINAKAYGRTYTGGKRRWSTFPFFCKEVLWGCPSLLNRLRIQVRVAVWASLVANFILCVLQCTSLQYVPIALANNPTLVYAAVSSVSLSLIATGIDATFDFGSNIFLYWTHKKALSMDINKWPVGGSRLETIGNIVYGDSFVHSAGNHLIFFQVHCSSNYQVFGAWLTFS